MKLLTTTILLGVTALARAVDFNTLTPVPTIDFSSLPFIAPPASPAELAAADALLATHFAGTQLYAIFAPHNTTNMPTTLSSPHHKRTTGTTCWTDSKAPLAAHVIQASNYLYKIGWDDEGTANCKMRVDEVCTRLTNWGTAAYAFCSWPVKYNQNCVLPGAYGYIIHEDCNK